MSHNLATVARTIPFTNNVAGTYTLYTGVAGRRFVVTKWFMTAAAAQTILFDSKPIGAATNLTGALNFSAAGQMQDGAADDVVFIANAAGDSLRITISANVQTDGYVVVVQIEDRQ